jgi:hypothetical protein
LAYDQQLALASGNMEAYWALQARIDNGGKPVTAPVAPTSTMATGPVAPADQDLYYYDAQNQGIVGYKPAYYEFYGPAGKPG